MGKLKIYNHGRGSAPYQAKKLLKDLEPIIERKMITDPGFAASFRPVDNYEDLLKMHSVHCAETATIISEVKNEPNINLSSMENGNPNIERNKSSETESSTNKQVIDPINEAEPIIRDYVLTDDAYEKKSSIPSPDAQNEAALNFGEPMNFGEAFDIPTDDNEDPKLGNKKEETKQSTSQNNTQQNSAPKKEPVNPFFEEQSNQNKKKQTKRMAKYIVKATVMLLEKGFVWWTTKDINEVRLIEMELKNEIDLSVLLALDENTQQTAREFFAKMCSDAMAASKVSEDDQEELTDALFEVLLEKGIAPTPMQNLALVGFQIIAAKALTALGLSSMVNSVLAGLNENHKQNKADNEEDEAEMERMANSAPTKIEKTDSKEEYETAEVVN